MLKYTKRTVNYIKNNKTIYSKKIEKLVKVFNIVQLSKISLLIQGLIFKTIVT